MRNVKGGETDFTELLPLMRYLTSYLVITPLGRSGGHHEMLMKKSSGFTNTFDTLPGTGRRIKSITPAPL